MNENEEENSNEINNNIKIILLGEMGTGKTNLISAYLGNKFEIFPATIAPKFSQKTVMINEQLYYIDIWDTMGHERYRSLTKNFIRGSHIVIFVYDITNRNSFDELEFWVNCVKEELSYEPVIGLVGNKIDLFEQEKVSQKDGEDYAEKIGALFEVTSAKENPDGFKDFVKKLIEKLLSKQNSVNITTDIISIKSSQIKKIEKKNCC